MSRVENRKLITRSGIRAEHPVDASLVGDQIKVILTNGTTAVNVFGAKGSPYNITITGFFVIAQDTTAGNITLANAGSTVAQVAKGTTKDAMTGEGDALANTSVKSGAAVTVASSSAGNAVCFITYTVDA
jgi:hypothetical protein